MGGADKQRQYVKKFTTTPYQASQENGYMHDSSNCVRHTCLAIITAYVVESLEVMHGPHVRDVKWSVVGFGPMLTI